MVFAAGLLANADLILHNSKIVTVNQRFTVRQAVAVEGSRIIISFSFMAIGVSWPLSKAACNSLIPRQGFCHFHPGGCDFPHNVAVPETPAARLKRFPVMTTRSENRPLRQAASGFAKWSMIYIATDATPENYPHFARA
jgi:hypothetical protein